MRDETSGSAAAGRPKVLQLGEIEVAHDAWAGIAAIADIVVPTATNRDDFLLECASGAFEGCAVAYRTFESARTTGRVDAALVAALPRSLRFVCHNGAGYDQVDVPACTARGIRVSNVRTAVDDATADTALFLMLGALRSFGPGLHSLRAGHWRGGGGDGGGSGSGAAPPPPPQGRDPEGKVLGVLGMGGIGRAVARKAVAAFGMRVLYHNRTRLGPEVERECGGAEYRGFEDLLRESDVLSLNLPLNEHTHHIISRPQLALMKPGSVLVNTARGAVVDEAALAEALADEGSPLAGAGLDVFEREPEIHPDLLASPRALLLPHMGTWTGETTAAMEEWTMANVRAAVEEGRLLSIVPEQRDMEG